MTRHPSNEMLLGRRALEGIGGVTLLKDFFIVDGEPSWVLSCRLTHSSKSFNLVAETTDWFVLVDLQYPFGKIEFHPSKTNSIVKTFPHQSYNEEGASKVPWRTGNICLSTPMHAFGRDTWDGEPLGADARLLWYFKRSLEWLHAAANNALLSSGDRFELPSFPVSSKGVKTFVFCESAETFTNWSKTPNKCGILSFKTLKSNASLAIVTAFKSADGTLVSKNQWGRAIADDAATEQSGIWLRFDKVPVFNPWHAPINWDELRIFCNEHPGFDLDGYIRPLMPVLRRSAVRLIALGFAIPDVVGQKEDRIHWQAFEVQNLCDGHSLVKGFQRNDRGFWQHDRALALQGAGRLPWVDSQNWAADQIQTRGSLSNLVTGKSFLLIGAGALGSIIGELLIRSGVQKLHVLDFDTLKAGNLVRHTLLLPDVGYRKSEQLAKRLNSASPHAQVEAINDLFPARTDAGRETISSCDVIIDCTASDSVLWELSKCEWSSPKWMFSISTGFGVRRLFLFSSNSQNFPVTNFRNAIDPWLVDELDKYEHESLPREGIGCWHPVFPGRIDDLWMFASLAVKEFTRLLENNVQESGLTVFARDADEDGFSCISRQKEVSCQT